MKSAVPALLCLLALTACTDREAELKAQQAAQAQHREQAADELARNYEKARADGQWQAAFLHGNALLRNYAGTAAAARVEQTFAEVRARAEAEPPKPTGLACPSASSRNAPGRGSPRCRTWCGSSLATR